MTSRASLVGVGSVMMVSWIERPSYHARDTAPTSLDATLDDNVFRTRNAIAFDEALKAHFFSDERHIGETVARASSCDGALEAQRSRGLHRAGPPIGPIRC